MTDLGTATGSTFATHALDTDLPHAHWFSYAHICPEIVYEHRHYADQIMFSLFKQEESYDSGIETWDETTAVQMIDFDDGSPHEVWDDTVEDDGGLVQGEEYATRQEIVRQSVTIHYREPRVKPSTLAGLLGLALGSVSSTQDSFHAGYRHKLTPVTAVALPSIAAQISHMHASQFVYSGLKAQSCTLRNNGAYVELAAELLGSGTRTALDQTFVGAVVEPWLRWGDCSIYLKDVRAAALSVPSTPVQGASNLGTGAIDISTRVRRLNLSYPNVLWGDGGYRPSTGVARGSLVGQRRQLTVELEFQVSTASEARDIGWYMHQTPLALEWQCHSTELIDADGSFYWGMTLLVPCLQWRSLGRDVEAEFDTLVFTGTVLSDRVNPIMQAWVYSAQAGYLL